MNTLLLRYSEVLLLLARRAGARADWPRFFDLCDRFERTLAAIVPDPLLWDGDYA